MEIKLAENIKMERKNRKLTQEQLAEVLGVTPGAVYKWESGQSIPELGMLLDMVDFFDTSVDALLGYKLKDNNLDAALERIVLLCDANDPAALEEAEKLLKRYPNSFKVNHDCAAVYLLMNISTHKKEYVLRALELLQQSLVLLPQNDDPTIGEHTIYSDISSAYMLLNEYEKSVEILKGHNIAGKFSDSIGVILALYLHKFDEAEKFLSDAMISGLSEIFSAVAGYTVVFNSRGEYETADELLTFVQGLIKDVRNVESAGYLDKIETEFLLLMAYTKKCEGKKKESKKYLEEAVLKAAMFDKGLNYGFGNIRYVSADEKGTVRDIFGYTATESLMRLSEVIGDNEFKNSVKREVSLNE